MPTPKQLRSTPRTESSTQAAAGRPARDWRSERDRSSGAGGARAAGTTVSPVYRALLPLRLFIGATFLYAGLDKLLDPAFLRETGPGSIGEQLLGFVRVSPIAPLVQIFAMPEPVLAGTLIALLEIAIGLGALTGLLYRASAVGGAALSFVFFLTASWATHPYYYGGDLPYAFGWVTLGLAGHGNVYAADSWFAAWAGEKIAGLRRGWPVPAAEVAAWTDDPGRRGFLQLAGIGIVAIALASVAGLIGRLRPLPVVTAQGGSGGGALGPTGITGAATGGVAGTGTSAGSGPAATASPTAPTGPTAQLIGTLSQIKPGQALAFQDNNTGDPAVLVRLASGSLVAYDALCTHAGCTVEYDGSSGYLICPCHGATFDPGAQAQPIAGPTNIPLTNLPLKIDQKTGKITLVG